MIKEGGIKLSANPENLKHHAPKISIIIPTLNASGTLQACLNSIYAQACRNIETIVMDGRSKDGTIAILEENSDNIYYWRSEQDKGIYHAMNKALEHVTGEWVFFLGSDDELLPDFSAMVSELENPSAIYYGNVIYKGKVCSGYISPYFMAKQGMHHQSMFYPASVFIKHRYNLDYHISADSILNMECWGDKAIKWIFKDYTVSKYSDTGISSAHTDRLLQQNQAKLILKHFGPIIWLRFLFRKLKAKLKKKFSTIRINMLHKVQDKTGLLFPMKIF